MKEFSHLIFHFGNNKLVVLVLVVFFTSSRLIGVFMMRMGVYSCSDCIILIQKKFCLKVTIEIKEFLKLPLYCIGLIDFR